MAWPVIWQRLPERVEYVVGNIHHIIDRVHADKRQTLLELKLAAIMVRELAGAEIVGELVDWYPEKVGSYPVCTTFGEFDVEAGTFEENICRSLGNTRVKTAENTGNTLRPDTVAYHKVGAFELALHTVEQDACQGPQAKCGVILD